MKTPHADASNEIPITHYLNTRALFALHPVTSAPPVRDIAGTYSVIVTYTDDEVLGIDQATLCLYFWHGAGTGSLLLLGSPEQRGGAGPAADLLAPHPPRRRVR